MNCAARSAEELEPWQDDGHDIVREWFPSKISKGHEEPAPHVTCRAGRTWKVPFESRTGHRMNFVCRDDEEQRSNMKDYIIFNSVQETIILPLCSYTLADNRFIWQDLSTGFTLFTSIYYGRFLTMGNRNSATVTKTHILLSSVVIIVRPAQVYFSETSK